MIRASVAEQVGAQVVESSQSAHQADGSSPLSVIGETRMTLVCDDHEFVLEALVIENLDVDVLAGTPFMEQNDLAIRPAKHQIILRDGTVYTYGSGRKVPSTHMVRRAQVLRCSVTQTVWPGEFIELRLPQEYHNDENVAIEPRLTSCKHPAKRSTWPSPDIIPCISGRVRIPNLTEEPKLVKSNVHLCQICPIYVPEDQSSSHDVSLKAPLKSQPPAQGHSGDVQLDPDSMLHNDIRQKFTQLLRDYDDVFDPHFKGYNGAVGPYQARVNMGPVQPPQRKRRVPHYNRDKLVELQDKFDRLEELGVFKRPEDIGIDVEYLNSSFLVKKPSGGFRLVIAFSEVGRYSKPQPALLPDVDSTLRQIGQWKYIIATDLASAFYQIPLARESMKYCGVATPFKGVRVYTRSAMGMPGSEVALEELMCRVLGDLLQEGIVVKLADDLYCGGSTPENLLHNWKRILQALHFSGLSLSAPKTIIASRSAVILGWLWCGGSLQASSHRISTLTQCPLPLTVKSLRSFIGAYKVLARVLPGCAGFLAPLDEAAAGKPSAERIIWTDELSKQFHTAQKALSTHKSITLPSPCDQLWIVTDGAVKRGGIGATLYVLRSGRLLLSGFFSAKLRKQQVLWLPCEVEALAIAVPIKHFSPFIVQSQHKTCILTDSKLCVQAFEKLCRGEFSASPRVTTFLSMVSRYAVSIRHVAGIANLPSDHASRNTMDCSEERCQVCGFIRQTEEATVYNIILKDIESGDLRLPFTGRHTWL